MGRKTVGHAGLSRTIKAVTDGVKCRRREASFQVSTRSRMTGGPHRAFLLGPLDQAKDLPEALRATNFHVGLRRDLMRPNSIKARNRTSSNLCDRLGERRARVEV